jgi:hypothetical protein
MSGAETHLEADEVAEMRPGWRRKRVLVPAGIVGALALALGMAWLSRERIAGNIVDGQLRSYDLPATYKIESAAPDRQVLSNVVVGNPSQPDLTVERIVVRIKYRLGTPQVGRITLINPRLYGRLVSGRVSFGALDRVIYRRTGKPPGLPAIDLAIRDGRALVETPYGPVGAKVEGAGLISDGFTGTAAIAAPALAVSGCRATGASLYGKVTTSAGEPHFAGPLRLASLLCPGRELALGRTDADLKLSSDKTFAALTGRASIAAGALRYADYRASGADATIRGNFKNGLLDERHTIALRGVSAPQAAAALVTLDGTLRASDGFAKADLRSDVEGNGLRPGPAFDRTLLGLTREGQGTLIEPLARRFAGALARQARGSSISADLAVRRNAGGTSVLIPQAEMRGGGGARILSLSRVEAGLGDGGTPRLSGNIATGGPDMPQITGRMERAGTGGTVFRLVMQPYSAGGSTLSIPQMSVAQAAGGALGFAGRVIASGPLPGGATRGLTLPVSGRIATNGSLALWRSCIDVAFDRLQIANLSLERRGLRLCPSVGRAIVESGRGGLRIAAGAPSLDLAGSLGRTPIRIQSGPVGFAYPGVMAARQLQIALGPADSASRFAISNLEAKLGGKDIAGRFDGADVRLDAVPLDLRDATGNWRFAGGVLTLTDGDFRLVDRQAQPRFEPLAARGGTLMLKDNVINGQAVLRNPATDRVVSNVAFRHDLAKARGHADLTVPGLLFDEQLQPDQLSARAKGVIANASGTISGTGRIDWTPNGVTSSGDFGSEGIDFAAAFGPVKGARGTVHFTDLIGLTTAPGQTLQIASVNPGIEVTDGEFTFQLSRGQLLTVEGGSWPFMGGRLILERVDLNFGAKEARRYVFRIEGLDAAAFIARFELPNISATGLFDGTVPIVFDENGNGRIEGGLLTSRPPGGNVSYIGDLSYKDLSTMANFAFDALRSLDYERMTIAMNGSLTGEIVTNVNFDGVKQGAGAKRNIITRALASLPIQFKINITAPFYQLITSFKSLRDPAAVRDPRDLGLLSDDGTRFIKSEVRGEDVQPKVKPEDIIPGKQPVQN